jgi:hypothetical protein
MNGTQVLLWSLGLFLLFTLLPIGEVWALKRLGLDIIARLQVSLKGEKSRFFFEAFGVVAFIMAQPIFFVWLFGRISNAVGAHFQEVLEKGLAAIS